MWEAQSFNNVLMLPSVLVTVVLPPELNYLEVSSLYSRKFSECVVFVVTKPQWSIGRCSSTRLLAHSRMTKDFAFIYSDNSSGIAWSSESGYHERSFLSQEVKEEASVFG